MKVRFPAMGIKFSIATPFADAMAPHNAVLPNALNTPGIEKLRNKRIVLASASPRRSEILQTLVSVPHVANVAISISFCPSVLVIYIHAVQSILVLI